MLHIKKLKTFFQKNEAARPPPILQKETFFEPAIILFRTERKKHEPTRKTTESEAKLQNTTALF